MSLTRTLQPTPLHTQSSEESDTDTGSEPDVLSLSDHDLDPHVPTGFSPVLVE